MRTLLAISVLGLCLTSFEALSTDRERRQPEPYKGRSASPYVKQAVDSHAESFRSIWSLSQELDDVSGHAGSLITFHSKLRLPQGPLLTADEELAGHLTSFAVPTADQQWNSKADDVPAIWITLAQRGLDYLKDVLLTHVLETITPCSLPNITKRANIPFVGEVSASFTNVTLVHTDVPSSTIALGDTGMTIQGSNAAANLTLSWQYDYHNIWIPGPVSDHGGADIKVVGMQAGVSVSVQENLGTLHMTILQCGTYIDNLEVQVKGESSWLYQW